MRPNTTATITNLTLTSANTGYSFAVPALCRGFSVQCRTAADVRFGKAKVDVESGGSPFITIKSGTVFNSPEAFASANETYWFGSSSAGVVLEILSWT